MANLPYLGAISETPRPQGTSATESIRDFGEGTRLLARGADALGDALSRKFEEGRQLNSAFAKADARLRYGEVVDSESLKYKEELKSLRVERGGDYGAAVDQLQQRYAARLDKLRQGHFSLLPDAETRLQFDVETRSQTQAALRGFGEEGVQQIRTWRKGVGQAAVGASERVAANVTGDPIRDLSVLAASMRELEPQLMYLRSEGQPEEAVALWLREQEAKNVQTALVAYGRNAKAGSALLNATIPGTDIRIGYDPNKPEQQSVLSGDDTAKWAAHFDQVGEAVQVAEGGAATWSAALKVAVDAPTGRFDPAKALAFFETQPAEARALLKQDFEHRVGLAESLQNKEDTQRVARLIMGLHEGRGLNVSSPDFIQLDDQGRAQVLSARRGRAESSSMGTRMAVAEFDNLGGEDPVEGTYKRAALTDEEIVAKFGHHGPLAVATLKARRTKLRESIATKGLASRVEFSEHADKAVRTLPKTRSGSHVVHGAHVRAKLLEWFDAQKVPPTIDMVDREIGVTTARFVVRNPWYTTDDLLYGYQLSDEQRKRAEFLPVEQQPTLEAKKLLEQRRQQQTPAQQPPADFVFDPKKGWSK